MAARQSAFLEKASVAARGDDGSPRQAWTESLEKLQRMLQASGAPSLKGEVFGRDALPMLLPVWEDLCARSAEDNVYYSPRYAQALLESAEKNTDVSFAVVWDDSRLVAFLPVTRPTFAIPGLRPGGRAWQSKYTYSCTPLLDAVLKVHAADALLTVLASISAGEWVLPTLNTDGEACQAMIVALAQRQMPWTFLNHFQRATLGAGCTFDEHMSARVDPKRRKGLARNRRRLEERGKLAHESHVCGAGLERAVAAFLEIEARGWKGRRGTALACDDRTRQFAAGAFTGEEGHSICRADVLTLDGAPIAVSLIAVAGRTGFAVKACYDEAYRSYSPGLLLETEVIRGFLSGHWADRLDSATSGTHVLESLWPGRIDVADLMCSLSPHHPALRLSALQRSSQLSGTVRRGLKRLVRSAR